MKLKGRTYRLLPLVSQLEFVIQRDNVACCICRQNSQRLRESSNRTRLDKKQVVSRMNERNEIWQRSCVDWIPFIATPKRSKKWQVKWPISKFKTSTNVSCIKWLRVAAAFIKRRMADKTKGWDDKVTDVPLIKMITEVVVRVHQEDSMRGKWYVDGPELDVCVDASSQATGVSLEYDGVAVEDASWLQKRGTHRTNLVELDAVVKGVNIALMWKATILHLHTDSACVHKCITDTLMGRLGCTSGWQVRC